MEIYIKAPRDLPDPEYVIIGETSFIRINGRWYDKVTGEECTVVTFEAAYDCD